MEPMEDPAGSCIRSPPPRVLGRVCMGTRSVLIGWDSSCSFSKPSVLICFLPLLSLASKPENAQEMWITLESLERYPNHSLPGLIRIALKSMLEGK